DGSTRTSGWSVRKAFETTRTYSSSLASGTLKATENVFVGSATIWLLTAAIADETMPPDRNIPRGTSDISRSLTDVRNNSRHSSMYSAADRERPSYLVPGLTSQKRLISTLASFHLSLFQA